MIPELPTKRATETSSVVNQASIKDDTYEGDSAHASLNSLYTAESGFSLEKSFPSILVLAARMSCAQGERLSECFFELSEIFLARLDDIIRSMETVLGDVPPGATFTTCRSGLRFIADLLRGEIMRRKESQDFNALTVNGIIEMIISNLRSLILLTEKSLLGAQVNLPTPLQDSSSDRGVIISMIEEDFQQRWTIFEGENSADCVECGDERPSHSSQAVSEETQHHQEVVPSCSTASSVTSVPPTECATDIIRDQDNAIKAATFRALVRTLTSEQGLIDDGFLSTFFTCFRLFSSPSRLLEELQRLFRTSPASTRGQSPVHIRIGKAIIIWLDYYWRPDADTLVLDKLCVFSVEQLYGSLPNHIVQSIRNGLNRVTNADVLYHRLKDARNLNVIYRMKNDGKASMPASFFTDLDLDTVNNTHLLTFDCLAGREVFAQQLTIRLSRKIGQIHPEDAISYWHRRRRETSPARETATLLDEVMEFQRALCSWVTSSILDETAIRTRCRLLEFWVDISARFVRLRNFSGANCVLCGLSNRSIMRLTRTISHVNEASKQQFLALRQFFEAQKNFGHYRQVLSSLTVPTVPVIEILFRDVDSALNVVPTVVGLTKANNEHHELINFALYRVVYKTARAMENCLIPYRISSSNTFQIWLDRILALYPSGEEDQLNKQFDALSHFFEAKDSTSGLVDAWQCEAKPVPNPPLSRQVLHGFARPLYWLVTQAMNAID